MYPNPFRVILLTLIAFNPLFPVCSRIGLDWACSVADILRGLNACPQWSVVIAAFTDHCVQQLPHTLRRTNLFTLLVLVGFPEVPPPLIRIL